MLRIGNVTFDCEQPARAAEFWAAALGYKIGEGGNEFFAEVSHPDGTLPNLLFIKVPEPRAVKNRVHLDLRPADRTREQETERILALGASQVADHRRSDGSGWITLADPEGNEFCILTRNPAGSGATT